MALGSHSLFEGIVISGKGGVIVFLPLHLILFMLSGSNQLAAFYAALFIWLGILKLQQ